MAILYGLFRSTYMLLRIRDYHSPDFLPTLSLLLFLSHVFPFLVAFVLNQFIIARRFKSMLSVSFFVSQESLSVLREDIILQQCHWERLSKITECVAIKYVPSSFVEFVYTDGQKIVVPGYLFQDIIKAGEENSCINYSMIQESILPAFYEESQRFWVIFLSGLILLSLPVVIVFPILRLVFFLESL